ncbi:GTPase activating factor, partial [Coemansia nantahalensis]
SAGPATADPGCTYAGSFPGAEGPASSAPAALYLVAARAHERNSWVGRLRQHARTFQLTASGPAGPLAFRIERCLWVRVLGAQGLALPCNATAMVVAGGNLLAQTPVAVNTAAPRWEGASFCFGGLGPSSSRLFVLVRQAGSGGGEGDLLGYSQIPLATLRRGQSYSGWYPLSYGDLAAADCELGAQLRFAPNVRPASNTSMADAAVPEAKPSIPFRSGDVHVQVRYDETIVLGRAAYREVAALLLDRGPALIFRLTELLPGSTDWLVETATKIAIWRGSAESWIEALVRHELGMRGDRDPTLLFRSTTVVTRAMDTLMKVVGLGFVDQLVGDVVRRVASNEYACEVDPTRLPPGNSIDVHWRALTRLLQDLWQQVEAGAASCPPTMRRVFCAIRRAVAAAFDQEVLGQVRYSCVSSFVFLRLLCPAMLAPRGFGLVCTVPSAASLRTLTLLAKGLQCAANLNGSIGKELYMQPMNDFVRTCVPRLKDFIDAIAAPPDAPPGPADTTPIDGEHELAVLCAFVHAARHQIREALASKHRLHTHGATPCASMPASPTEVMGRGAHISPVPAVVPASIRTPEAPTTVSSSPSLSSPPSPTATLRHLGLGDAQQPPLCVAPLEHLAYASVEHLIRECGHINDCVAHLHSHVDQPAVRAE